MCVYVGLELHDIFAERFSRGARVSLERFWWWCRTLPLRVCARECVAQLDEACVCCLYVGLRVHVCACVLVGWMKRVCAYVGLRCTCVLVSVLLS